MGQSFIDGQPPKPLDRRCKRFSPDLRVHLDDGGDHLDAHLRPLHDAGVGRGDRRRPL